MIFEVSSDLLDIEATVEQIDELPLHILKVSILDNLIPVVLHVVRLVKQNGTTGTQDLAHGTGQDRVYLVEDSR